MIWWLCGKMCLFCNGIGVRGVICNSASELWINFLLFREIRYVNSLRSSRPRNCGLIPSRGKIYIYIFSTKRSIPARAPISCLFKWNRGALSPKLRRPGLEAHHLPVYSTEVKNEWSCASFPLYDFVVCTVMTSPLFLTYSIESLNKSCDFVKFYTN